MPPSPLGTLLSCSCTWSRPRTENTFAELFSTKLPWDSSVHADGQITEIRDICMRSPTCMDSQRPLWKWSIVKIHPAVDRSKFASIELSETEEITSPVAVWCSSRENVDVDFTWKSTSFQRQSLLWWYSFINIAHVFINYVYIHIYIYIHITVIIMVISSSYILLYIENWFSNVTRTRVIWKTEKHNYTDIFVCKDQHTKCQPCTGNSVHFRLLNLSLKQPRFSGKYLTPWLNSNPWPIDYMPGLHIYESFWDIIDNFF